MNPIGVPKVLPSNTPLNNCTVSDSFRGEETQPLEKVTVSIGVASYPEDAQSLRELMKRADIALYSAKDMGRNQVCVYDKSMSSITESTMGIVT